MSFVSEYNLGRDESTTYFLASRACSLRVPALWPALLSQTGGTQARGAYHKRGHQPFHGLTPIIPFALHICQAHIVKRLPLSQHSCHGTRFMLLFAYS